MPGLYFEFSIVAGFTVKVTFFRRKAGLLTIYYPGVPV